MKNVILIALLSISCEVVAQYSNISGVWGSHFNMANQLYEGRFYEEAIIHYKKEIERYNFHEESYLKIADCYRRLGNYEKSRSYYVVVLNTSEVGAPIHKYYYAEALLSTGDYEEAERWYNIYSEENPYDSRPAKRIEGIKQMNTFFKDSINVKIKSFSNNTEHTEFGAVPFRGGVVFSSSRNKDLVIRHDYMREIESLLDLYVLINNTDSTWNLEQIKLNNHWKSNDGPIAVTDDYLIVTRNNGKKKDKPGNHLGLYFYETNENNDWKLLYPFPFNNSSYSVIHPSLNARKDTLFFSSDMPGGFGGKDIYYSIYNGSKWNQPVNMGAPVNTAGDEVFPFYERGKLYFSSNGLAGIGGLDIYKISLNAGQDENPVNMGYPLNTGWDDFSMYIKNKKGFLASNRPGGQGNDDIYEFELTEPKPELITKVTMNLIISDILNSDPVTMAQITVTNTETKFSIQFYTDSDGTLKETLNPATYHILISSIDYKEKEITLDLNNVKMVAEEIFLDPILSFENINLDSILFEYNDFKLSKGAEMELDQIIETMHKYSEITLDISAHTDSRGNADYNHWLSEMRAAQTANYLIESGVKFERINFTGYGETMPLNECKDGVPCTEEEHSVNRRIEFKFIVDQK